MKNTQPTNTKQQANLMTLKQVAAYLNLSYSNVTKNWPDWERFGVRAYRLGNRLRFKKEHIDQMIEMHAVN